MEFGKTDTSLLADINFFLPPDPPANRAILAGKPSHHPHLHIGCARWGSKEWLGSYYPEHTKEKDFLLYYSKLFNCVELSTTYYRVPSPEQVKQWKSKVDKSFRFCAKFPQFITHVMRLQNCDKEINEFIHSIDAFEENLGPVFLMPHPHMGVKDLPVIRRFVERLPSALNVFLELRNHEWFAGGIHPHLYDFAMDYEIGLVITDVAGRRDCVHMQLSKKETFVRFVGNDLHPTDYSRIQNWASRFTQWMNQGIDDIYFFTHQQHELNAPVLNKYLLEQLPAATQAQLPAIHAIRPQATLFD